MHRMHKNNLIASSDVQPEHYLTTAIFTVIHCVSEVSGCHTVC